MVGFSNLEGSWAPSSEERSLLHKTHYGIQLTAGGDVFNAEVFVFPCKVTVPFAIMVLVLPSYIRFRYEWETLTAVAFFTAVTLVYNLVVFVKKIKQRAERSMRIYFVVMLFIGFTMGYFIGEKIYKEMRYPYYQYEQLKIYKNVNPKTDQGTRYSDAGIVYFEPGAQLKANRNACVKSDNAYCVAPIVHCGPVGNCPELDKLSETGNFDFWAVGQDCCGCPNGEFRCGDWNNPLAHGGLRVVEKNPENLLMYNLAVKQWEAMYGKSTKHPLFFDWTLKPAQEASQMGYLGQMNGIFAIASFLGAQLVVSFIADHYGVI